MAKVSDIEGVPTTGLSHIDALISDTGGYPAWNYLLPARSSNTLYYTFSVSESLETPTPTNLTAFNDTQKAAARSILEHVSTVTGVKFSEVSSGSSADIHFGYCDISGSTTSGLTSWNSSYYHDSAQTLSSYSVSAWVYLDNREFANQNSSPTSGGQGYETLLHEIGHLMGLKHPFEGNNQLSSAVDNTNNTVMSYTDAGTYKAEFSHYDQAALRYLYGSDGLGGATGLNSSQTGKTLSGTSGNDAFGGTSGTDMLLGMNGADSLLGGDADDSIYGNVGNDTLMGGWGNDFLYAGKDDDIVHGEYGNDKVLGDNGNDSVYGNVGNDTVYGNAGNDTVYGGKDDDVVYAGRDNDRLFGDDGNDALYGDAGNDTLTGGNGSDTFVFRSGGGTDIVTDFSGTAGDRLQLASGTSYTTRSDGSGGVVVDIGNGDTITLQNVASLSGDWVIYV